MCIKRNFCSVFLLLFIVVAVTSCYSKKELVYLQSKEFSTLYPTQIKNRRPDYKIQPSDVLYVTIQNPDTETYSFFNVGNENFGARGGNEAMLYLLGHSVSQEGYITIPLLGNIKVSDLSLDEATDMIQNEVNKYIRNSTVSVKLVSFKISVLGEVNNPGYYYIYNAQATVLEGLGLAGDITDTGNRKNIKLIRQTDNGAEVILLDLNNADLMNSKYYYLLPNDVLYVEPSDEQVSRSNFQPLGIGFSAVSSLAAIISIILNLRR